MSTSRTCRAGLVTLALLAASVPWTVPAAASGYSTQQLSDVGSGSPSFSDPMPSLSPDPLTSDPALSTPPVTADPTLSSDPSVSTPPVSSVPPSSVPPVSTPPVSSVPPSSVPPVSTPPVVSSPPPVLSSPPPPDNPPPTHRPPHVGGPHKTPRPHPHKVLKTPRPHPHKVLKTPRPHPHKTLRPTPVHHSPGAKRPHPHRKPWPITLTLKTAPALAGMRFTIDGHPVLTGSDGTASYTAEHDFLAHRLSLVSSSLATPTKRFQFNRWAGQRDPNQAFSRTVSGLPLRSNYVITAAFAVQQQVVPRVVYQDGTPLDPTKVSSITARSDTGALVSLPLTSATWLDGLEPVFHHSVLTVRPVSYSLQSVIVRGTNVVDAGRQTFTPTTTANPTFKTQFHNLVITGHDAIFKSALGTTATVTFPDGSTQTVRLNAEHTATLLSLPRGNYKVTIKAGRAIVAAQQFTLSKDKTADIAVISIRDLAVLLGVLLLIAVALLVIGRQYWRRPPHRRLPPPPDVVLPREKILT